MVWDLFAVGLCAISILCSGTFVLSLGLSCCLAGLVLCFCSGGVQCGSGDSRRAEAGLSSVFGF